jgi:hypothetical protein
MADINDLLDFSMNQQPTKFASAFDEIMGQKTLAAIEDMHTTVAQNMFGSEEDTDFDIEDEDISDEDLDDEEFDVSDEDLDAIVDDDFEDIEWDEEEFELEDEDLEGFEDDGEDA